jgi:hypothetical protein
MLILLHMFSIVLPVYTAQEFSDTMDRIPLRSIFHFHVGKFTGLAPSRNLDGQSNPSTQPYRSTCTLRCISTLRALLMLTGTLQLASDLFDAHTLASLYKANPLLYYCM